MLTYNQPMNLVELAQRIRSCRIDRRMTLEEVASVTGLSRSWSSKVDIFSVTPSFPALTRMASTLNLSLSELVKGLDDRPTLVVVRKCERKTVARIRSKVNRTIY